MKILKILSVVVLLLSGAGLYLYNSVKLPDLPDASGARSDLADGATGVVYIKSRAPYSMSVLLKNLGDAPEVSLPVEITLPLAASAENPVPAMVIIHGSGGIAEGREREYAVLLADHGIASLVMDYYAARGVDEDTDYMTKVMSTTETDLIVDAFSSLKALGSHPAIDAKHIGVMGFSYGGMVARYVLNKQLKELLAPRVPAFAVHVDFYGPCHQTLMSDETTGAPYLSLRGAEDASNDLDACAEVEAVLEQMGSQVETQIYETAGHAWEVEAPRQLHEESPYVAGCEFSFNVDGVPTIDGVANYEGEPAADASRNMRYFQSLISYPEAAAECIKYGYIIGKDLETRDQAYQTLLSFLKVKFDL